MSASWDPYGSGGHLAHVPPGGASHVPINHRHHLAAPVPTNPNLSGVIGNGGSGENNEVINMSSSGALAHQPLPRHSVPFHSEQPVGSHGPPPYAGVPVIHPYPAVTSTIQHGSSYHTPHLLAPVPHLPGTDRLPAPILPLHHYGPPVHHIPFTTQSMPPHYQSPTYNSSHSAFAQPYNLKVNSAPSAPPDPIPQTPNGPSPPYLNGPQHPGIGLPPPGPELDLPPELLSMGWRKCWSKREDRWYYFNSNSGESLWDLPPLPGRYPPQPLREMDGLCDPNANGQLGNSLKRRASDHGEQLGSPVVKKFILAGPWDLEVPSNICSSTPAFQNPDLLPPHPDIELQRAQLIAKLRQCYQQSCQSREGIDAPKESLNRWIMERKISDRGGVDPVFPSCDTPEGIVSQVMFNEIINDVPMKVIKPRFTGDARKQLAKYTDACKRIITTRDASSEARKLVKWKVEETVSWLQKTVGAPYEAFQERLEHLKETCQPHVHAAAKSSVEGICKKMSVLAKQYGQTIREAHLKLFVEPQHVKENHHEPQKGRYACHPTLCGGYTFSEKLPPVDYMPVDKDHVLLKYKNDIVRISSLFLQKLEQLYRYNCVDDLKFEFFLARCYCLLRRYNSYCEDYISAHRTQSALPVTVFESIQRNFDVTFECFASPLNCYFRQFCSAFPDVDGYFGSRGTFLDYEPVSGSFQMNMPFSEELMDAAISHTEELLGKSMEPLSFIIFVPEWSDDKNENSNDSFEFDCPWIEKLENSKWKRRKISVPAYEHEYRHALQHILPKAEVNVRSTHKTAIFWLQNEAGYDEWKPTDEKVDALTDAYRPGRERERDRQELLAPERQNPHQADKAVAAAVAAMNSA